ncbi:CbiX/SirB N-terminal domain-containing protein [Streptomyces yaizuensis]|uniref:CbiX/SirB N-terminal domain-containing protein n=1 Tax=Streptomyces yaizuensis TaxID=2989713 RepID=A0ABQ5NYF2_9ACTN|nr:CbiX/SirB N-terminal domain-containing protein [Streptomyces sp. YSPA8]
MAAPEGAPALVLAVPGVPSPASRALAEETVSIARSELPGLEVGVGYLEGDESEYASVAGVLARISARRTERYEIALAAGREVAAPEGPAAVVVPLLAGPDSALMERIRQAVADSGAPAETTDVLGPHPLLAEAVHVRLSEAGLARADRARLFTVATAADGIVLATVGGEEAVQAAGITGMLLAARLAVPVMAAALDREGSVGAVADQLRASGSTQLALAPYLIGPELPEGLLEAAAKDAGCSAAEALGAYPAIGKLVLSQYTTLLGIAPRPQGLPTH